jgi:hypothetical protein
MGYSEAWERAMKIQEVVLRALSGEIHWFQAAEILGVSMRTMRRYRWGLDKWGYEGLFDRRRGSPSPRRVPVEEVKRVLRLYRERYRGWNVRHFFKRPVEAAGPVENRTRTRFSTRTLDGGKQPPHPQLPQAPPEANL